MINNLIIMTNIKTYNMKKILKKKWNIMNNNIINNQIKMNVKHNNNAVIVILKLDIKMTKKSKIKINNKDKYIENRKMFNKGRIIIVLINNKKEIFKTITMMIQMKIIQHIQIHN